MNYFIVKPKNEAISPVLIEDILREDPGAVFVNRWEDATRVVFAKNWNRNMDCIRLHQKLFHDEEREICYGFWYKNYKKECPKAPTEIITEHIFPYHPVEFEEIILE